MQGGAIPTKMSEVLTSKVAIKEEHRLIKERVLA